MQISWKHSSQSASPLRSVTKTKLDVQSHNHYNQTAQRKMPLEFYENEYNVKTWKLLLSKTNSFQT